ncbi:MAG: alpha/beta hydrolase [Verrucomicrobiales bacterium]
MPGTAVLDFGAPPAPGGAPPAPGGAMPVRLRLLNSFTEAKFAMGGKARPLARDLTAVVDATLDDPYITRNALEGFFRPNKRQEDSGLFGLTSYDPSKIPVVFVHGLRSDSHIWKNAVNELLADPALSARYQPLFFLYPSGLSVPSAAARFRESLREYRAFWDPAGTHQNLDRMILVGHSMGGLLCQLQVISSGEDFERAFFQSPVEDVPFLTGRQAAGIKRTLFFEPQPFVDRAVFIAVPHRGSTLADLKIVRLFIRLIHLPSDALGLATSALTEDPSFLNPALLSYNLLGLRSVDMLSLEHPYFKALEARAIEVPHHSIIGDRGKGDTPESSDGVVPYWSSHLPAAGSEVIVPYGHSCTHTPEVIAEILRVLRLHGEGG